LADTNLIQVEIANSTSFEWSFFSR